MDQFLSIEASSHRRHCKLLCGGMEIPCWVTFTFLRKATLNRLKALLKVLIYANLWHGVQIFSQISCIPDLIRKFWAKKGGLYAGVYGSPSWFETRQCVPVSGLAGILLTFSAGCMDLHVCIFTGGSRFFNSPFSEKLSSRWSNQAGIIMLSLLVKMPGAQALLKPPNLVDLPVI